MKSEVKLTISIGGEKETALLICDNKDASIIFMMENGFSKTYADTDFYRCFGRVREDNPHIQFFCKGAKVNVYPSSMATQMSRGLKAYELTMGKKTSLEDIVYIFDYDDDNLTSNPEIQRQFFREWIESEKK